jgi:hypothetical protein
MYIPRLVDALVAGNDPTLILPAATGIAPVLTLLAATGLAVIMVGAIITHARRREPSAIAFNVVR